MLSQNAYDVQSRNLVLGCVQCSGQLGREFTNIHYNIRVLTELQEMGVEIHKQMGRKDHLLTQRRLQTPHTYMFRQILLASV